MLDAGLKMYGNLNYYAVIFFVVFYKIVPFYRKINLFYTKLNIIWFYILFERFVDTKLHPFRFPFSLNSISKHMLKGEMNRLCQNVFTLFSLDI